MFTGIIENTGRVKSVSQSVLSVEVIKSKPFSDVKLGESIAVNGCCLTVISEKGNLFSFEVSPETNAITKLGNLKSGDLVNLERALRLQDRLSGHLVQGHVDTTATCIHIGKIRKYFELGVEFDAIFSRYCSHKGSVSLDGVSLTINKIILKRGKIQLFHMIIPHTWNHTNLSKCKVGSRLNVELDMIAKVVEGLILRKN